MPQLPKLAEPKPLPLQASFPIVVADEPRQRWASHFFEEGAFGRQDGFT
jgi:hypothetical protein